MRQITRFVCSLESRLCSRGSAVRRLHLHAGSTDAPETQDSEPTAYPDGYTEANCSFT